MIIPKIRLNAEAVRQMSSQLLQEQLTWQGNGYKCTSELVCDVLMKAAVEG